MALRTIPTSVPDNSPFEITILATNGRYNSQSYYVELQLSANRQYLTEVLNDIEILPQGDHYTGYWIAIESSLAAGQ